MSSIRRVIRTIISRSLCIKTMDESTRTNRNRPEKKKKQQKKESDLKSINDNDNDDVFNEDPERQQTTPEVNISTENLPVTEVMTSTPPNRPLSTASSGTSAISNQNTSNSNKAQPVKQNKPASASGGKARTEASSTIDTTEITERPASTTTQSKPKGPPINIPPKVELTRAERRALQEAQRAAKQQKSKPGATASKSNETQQMSSGAKKSTADYVSSPSVPPSIAASFRPQSEAGDSTISVTSRSTRAPSNAIPIAPGTSNQSQQKRQPKKSTDDRVTLFAHLTIYTRNLEKLSITPESKLVHPAIIKLGLQYATRQIVGSNLRCVTFLVAIQKMLQDYEGPPGSNDSSILDPVDLNTKLKLNINFLTKCRPNAVTMGTAIRFLKTHIERIPRNITNKKAKELLTEVLTSFLREKIDLSSTAIAETYAITKITNGDVILIFGYSSLIIRILETAINRGIDFRVIIVDSRPQQHGLRSAQRLLALNVKCTYVLINAVPFIISEVTKVLLGAHGLLGNGYVMSQVGTAQISLIAKTHNVPVLVCCETYKFCERVQTDSFVFNELGDPNDLIADHPLLQTALSSSSTEASNASNPKLNILNMTYDVTPPTFISAVITELGILPCTSVAVVIRMQNKQLDEICGQEQQSTTATSTTTASNMNVFSSSHGPAQ